VNIDSDRKQNGITETKKERKKEEKLGIKRVRDSYQGPD
jgi:hypothetical protein